MVNGKLQELIPSWAVLQQENMVLKDRAMMD